MQGLRPLYRYFDFVGRSGRAEYWQFVGLVLIASVIAFLLDAALGQLDMPILMLMVGAICIVPLYSVAVRRLHDHGRSGKWLIAHAAMAIIGLFIWRAAGANSYTATGTVIVYAARACDLVTRGLILYFFYLLVTRGDAGHNQFGRPPNGIDDLAPTFQDLVGKVRGQADIIAPVAVARPRTSGSDPLEQIERLAKLRDAGALTDQEFAEQKATYLTRL